MGSLKALRRSLWRRRALCVLAAGWWVAVAGAATSSEEENLATFDAAWELILETHFDPATNGVDWQAVREELRPRARDARAPQELRQVIHEMVGRLGQSHFGLIPKAFSAEAGGEASHAGGTPCGGSLSGRLEEALETGPSASSPAHPGIEIRILDDQVPAVAAVAAVVAVVAVVAVEPESPAAAAGIRAGYLIKKIDGEDVAALLACLGRELAPRSRTYLRWSVMVHLLGGEAGSQVVLTLERGGGDPLEVTVSRVKPPGTVARFGNLPPLRTRLSYRWLDARETEGRIGVIRFNLWLLPVRADFAAAMKALANADGIILDLRGNLGGIAGLAQGIAGHFFHERRSLGTLVSRRDRVELVVNPQLVSLEGEPLQPYDGPVAILIDALTGSTSEIFAAAFQDHGRARLFGQPSSAAALPAAMDRLPNGDVLLHATADFIRPNGQRIEGNAVRPDQVVTLTRDHLLAGRDETLLEAARWIQTQPPP